MLIVEELTDNLMTMKTKRNKPLLLTKNKKLCESLTK